jgi:hypothetical protein
MENNEEEEGDDNYPEFPEYSDTFMGEAEGEVIRLKRICNF